MTHNKIVRFALLAESDQSKYHFQRAINSHIVSATRGYKQSNSEDSRSSLKTEQNTPANKNYRIYQILCVETGYKGKNMYIFIWIIPYKKDIIYIQ
jgi:hypothetical protein